MATINSVGVGLSGTSGSGAFAGTTSPTFVTPVLGTPTSGTLTSCTGLPVSTGISGLGTGAATALGTNVGSAGAVVVNGGALGTPSSGTLTNGTGLPISTGVSGLGTGIATFLATPSSANLAAAVTDETGSGALVFQTSPTLNGTVAVSSNNSGCLVVTSGNITGGANVVIINRTANADERYMSFQANGVEIGNVDGNNTSVAFNTTSDARLKTDTGKIPKGLNEILALTVRNFDWNQTGKNQDGIFAQEAYKFFPNMVTPGSKEEVLPGEVPVQSWMVDYSSLVPNLIQSIQDLNALIVELKNEIEELKVK